ncbi:unnamed protein product [Spodoptera exigua]|nr:unnamed protein product [Spodoptera exigua]
MQVESHVQNVSKTTLILFLILTLIVFHIFWHFYLVIFFLYKHQIGRWIHNPGKKKFLLG